MLTRWLEQFFWSVFSSTTAATAAWIWMSEEERSFNFFSLQSEKLVHILSADYGEFEEVFRVNWNYTSHFIKAEVELEN